MKFLRATRRLLESMKRRTTVEKDALSKPFRTKMKDAEAMKAHAHHDRRCHFQRRLGEKLGHRRACDTGGQERRLGCEGSPTLWWLMHCKPNNLQLIREDNEPTATGRGAAIKPFARLI